MAAEFAEVLRRAMDARIGEVWTAMPARVDTYDATAQTVDVTPMVRAAIATEDDSAAGVAFEDLPAIPGVPVLFPRGGSCAITWPISPGDHVLLVVSTWDPSGWRADGVLSDPGFILAHYLGGCFALPGIAPIASPIASSQATANAIVLDGPEIRLIKTATGPDDYIALAKKVDDNFAALKSAIAGAAPAPAQGGPAVDSIKAAVAGASFPSVASARVRAK